MAFKVKKSKIKKFTKQDKEIFDVYYEGYDKGYKEGYSQGHTRGIAL